MMILLREGAIIIKKKKQIKFKKLIMFKKIMRDYWLCKINEKKKKD
jgi:hypothetical protein